MDKAASEGTEVAFDSEIRFATADRLAKGGSGDPGAVGPDDGEHGDGKEAAPVVTFKQEVWRFLLLKGGATQREVVAHFRVTGHAASCTIGVLKREGHVRSEGAWARTMRHYAQGSEPQNKNGKNPNSRKNLRNDAVECSRRGKLGVEAKKRLREARAQAEARLLEVMEHTAEAAAALDVMRGIPMLETLWPIDWKRYGRDMRGIDVQV